MKSGKLTALLCAAAVAFSATVSMPLVGNNAGWVQTAAAEEGINITTAEGWLESAYVEWTNSAEVDDYNVYVKGGKFTDYTRIDSELVREYHTADKGTYYRADALGLPEGTYTMKVEAVTNGAVTSAETGNLTVTAYTREGFAFSQNSTNKTASGGYNDDGSVPDNANIIYVTGATAKTVKAEIQYNSGKSTYECTGLEEILQYLAKNGETRRTIIRIIGTVMAPVTDRYTGEVLSAQDDVGTGTYLIDSNGYLVLKQCTNVTIEGVGNDATLKGIGILVKSANNLEVRNLGIMLFKDDGISLDTANENIWVHNNDVFYGMPGSDADQVKGDGSIDCKKSQYVTISGNHFWDGGKASLLDASATTTEANQSNYITYHHNWFDHSDSRHPRIRHATVHIYNNYFDGNAKYGTGVTSGASAFVEANVYRNCKNPFFSSEQGSEGGTTLSNEAGGIIKAYNNQITGGNEPIYASADNKNDFDAYLAASRDEKITSDYTTLVNTYKSAEYPNTYNNFDTDSSVMYDYTPDAPSVVAANVEKYAGRGEYADFTYEFDDSTADTSYAIDETLKDDLIAYTSSFVRIFENSSEPEPTPTATTSAATPTPTAAPNPTATAETGSTAEPTETEEPDATEEPTHSPLPSGTQIWYAGDTVAAGDTLTIPGLTAVDAMSGGTADATLNGIAFNGTARGKTAAATDGKSGSSIKFVPASDGIFTVYYKSDKTYTFYITDEDGNTVASYYNDTGSNTSTYTSANVEAGKTYYAFEPGMRIYFYGASFSPAVTHAAINGADAVTNAVSVSAKIYYGTKLDESGNSVDDTTDAASLATFTVYAGNTYSITGIEAYNETTSFGSKQLTTTIAPDSTAIISVILNKTATDSIGIKVIEAQ